MATPTFVASAYGADGALGTVPLPSGVQLGDVAIVLDATQAGISAPGWTAVQTGINGSSGYYGSTGNIYQRTVDAAFLNSGIAGYQLTSNDTAHNAWSMVFLRGGSISIATPAVTNYARGGTPTLPAVAAGQLLGVFHCTVNTPPTPTPPPTPAGYGVARNGYTAVMMAYYSASAPAAAPYSAGDAESCAVLMTPVATPYADLSATSVTGLQAYPGPSRVRLIWTGVSGATGYDYRVNGGTPVAVTSGIAVAVTGLTNGTSYTLEVRPTNPSSTGAWTSITATANPSTYDAAILADTPLAYWSLDELTGTFEDLSGNGYALTAQTGAVRGRAGAIAGSAASAGSAPSANIGYITPLPVAFSALPLSFDTLVSLPTGNCYGSFFKEGDSNGWGAGVGSTTYDSANPGRVLCFLNESLSWQPTTYTFPDSGATTVFHVACTRTSGGLITAYVNGVQVWSGTSSQNTGTGSLYVGGSNGTTRALIAGASLDNPAFYSSLLTGTQITNHYNAAASVTGAVVSGLAAAARYSGAYLTWNPTFGATSYDYRVNGGTPVTGITGTTTTVTGLTNGTTYTVEIRPVNSTSTGAWIGTTVTPSASAPQFTYSVTSGVIQLAGPTGTEQIVPGMDASGLQGGAYANLNITMQWSVSQSGLSKSSIIRVRQDSVTGTVLYQQAAGDQGDSGAGNQNTLTVAAQVKVPTSGRIVVTYASTNGNPSMFSANRVLTVAGPADASAASAASVIVMPVSGGAALVNTLTAPASSLDYMVDGGSVQSTSTAVTMITGLTNGTPSVIRVRARNATTTGPWSTFTITPGPNFMLDSFDRSDVTPSTTALGTSSDGHTWSQPSGTVGITGGNAYSAAGGESYATVAGAYNVDIVAIFSTAGTSQGIMFRYRDTNNFWLIQNEGTILRLYRKVAGTYNIVYTTPTLNAQAAVVMRIQAIGSEIKITYGGVVRIIVEDNMSYSTDTILGARFDSANVRLDFFSAAPPGAADNQGTAGLGDYSVLGAKSTPQAITGYVYKGRDGKNLDSVGAS